MTESTAEKAATVVVGVAVAGAAWYVLRTPALRRTAWRLAAASLTGTVPAWFRREIEAGWQASRPS